LVAENLVLSEPAIGYLWETALFGDARGRPEAATAAFAALRVALTTAARVPRRVESHYRPAGAAPVPLRTLAAGTIQAVLAVLLQQLAPRGFEEAHYAYDARVLRAAPLLGCVVAAVRSEVVVSFSKGTGGVVSPLVCALASDTTATPTLHAAMELFASDETRVGAAAAGLVDALKQCLCLVDSGSACVAPSLLTAAGATFGALPSLAHQAKFLRALAGRSLERVVLQHLIEARSVNVAAADAVAGGNLGSPAFRGRLVSQPRSKSHAAPLLLLQAALLKVHFARCEFDGCGAALAADLESLATRCENHPPPPPLPVPLILKHRPPLWAST